MNIKDPNALIHLGFAIVVLAFCGSALFTTHDQATQGQIWHIVFLLLGLWLPSPSQTGQLSTVIGQLLPVVASLAQQPATQPIAQPGAAKEPTQ